MTEYLMPRKWTVAVFILALALIIPTAANAAVGKAHKTTPLKMRTAKSKALALAGKMAADSGGTNPRLIVFTCKRLSRLKVRCAYDPLPRDLTCSPHVEVQKYPKLGLTLAGHVPGDFTCFPTYGTWDPLEDGPLVLP